MTSRDRKRAKRRATRRLADWRDRWAPLPLGRGAAARAKTARREALMAARGTLVLAHNAYREMHSVQCPRGNGGVMHARTVRHKMERIKIDIGCTDGVGVLHVWEYTASGFELVRSERLDK